jgi:hypothetical protein
LQQFPRKFPASQSRRTKNQIENATAAVRRKSGDNEMRQEPTPMDGGGQPSGYTFFFQIANDGERRACCVKVDAPDIHEAAALFREKWPVIESMARDGIKTGIANDGVIALVMP